MEKEKDVWSFKTSDLVTIPNIITYVRFVLIIPFVYFFLAEQYIYAAICIGLSGLSDCFDGMAARKLNQVTPLGKRQGNAFCGRYLYGDLCAYGSSDSCNTSGQRPYYAPRRCRFNQKKTHSAFCKLVRKGRNNHFLLFRMSYRISQGLFCLRKYGA